MMVMVMIVISSMIIYYSAESDKDTRRKKNKAEKENEDPLLILMNRYVDIMSDLVAKERWKFTFIRLSYINKMARTKPVYRNRHFPQNEIRTRLLIETRRDLMKCKQIVFVMRQKQRVENIKIDFNLNEGR